MLNVILGYLFLTVRIVFLGAERIFIKFFEKDDTTITTSILFLTAALLLSPVLLFIPFEAFFLDYWNWLLIIIASIVYSLGFFSYVKAIALGDTALIAPLYYLSLLWLLPLGLIFLGDDVGLLRVAGGLLMFIGVFFLYPGKLSQRLSAIRSSSASIWMIFGSIFIAIGRTIDASIIQEVNTFYYGILSNLFIGIILLVIIFLQGKQREIKRVLTKRPKYLFAGSFVFGWGYIALLLAISILQVTIAEPASLLSIFVTAFLAKIVFDEDVKERLPGSIIMVIGAILLLIS